MFTPCATVCGSVWQFVGVWVLDLFTHEVRDSECELAFMRVHFIPDFLSQLFLRTAGYVTARSDLSDTTDIGPNQLARVKFML